MRIHELTITAFGPFAERVRLDLDALSAPGLFLIHGPTGSGKTSLLDALCFGFYGDLPGARRSGRRELKSNHGDPADVPTVTIEFSSGGTRYRIVRTAEFERPKARGTGTTKANATVTLSKSTGSGWDVVSTRIAEVAEVVHDLLGMKIDQFAKVILLPQGEFASFLRAKPEERGELLERLFDVSDYAGIEDWLAEERRRTGAAAERAAEEARTVRQRVADLLGELEDPTCAEGLSEEFTAIELAELQDRVHRSAAETLAGHEEATNREARIVADLTTARTLARDQERGTVASGRLAQLEAAAPLVDEARRLLDRAQRTQVLGGHRLALARARSERDTATASAAELAETLQALGAPAEDLAGLLEGLHAQDTHVREFTALRGQRADLARAAAKDVTAIDRAGRALAAAQEAHVRSTERAEAAAEEAAVAHRAAQALPGVELARQQATDLAALAAAVARDEPRIAALRVEVLAAQESSLQARSDLVELQQRRLDGMAAQLAAGLSPGVACPVCGSPEHPAPAEGGVPVEPEEIREAQALVEAARERHTELEREWAALDATNGERRRRLGPLTEADAAMAAEDAAAAADRARAEAARLEATRAAAAAATTRLATSAEELTRSREVLTETRTAAALHRRALDEADEALAGLLGAHADCACGGDLEADPVAHETLTDLVERLAEVRAGLIEREARCGQAEADLVQAAVEAGFATLDEADEAAMDAARVRELGGQIAEHDRAVAAARGTLAEEVVAAALAADPPDLEALDQQRADARRLVLATRDAQQRTDSVARRLDDRLAEFVEVLEREEPLRARAHEVRALAELMLGTHADNQHRMRLTSYVLAARLERVAELANERLDVMGAGRYRLRHTDTRVGGNARSGLGIEVLDQWTGHPRETTTLSGGESFMASLALALGLADAVREEAGGLELGTLFVDEGFGSLDEDSLEEVMTVLDGLREAGRAVGVVSHVADLRTRIPTQVVVHKRTTGSTVTTLLAGSASEQAQSS